MNPKQLTISIHAPHTNTPLHASFKFESGDLKDEGRIEFDSVLEYDVLEPANIRFSHIILAPHAY